MTMNSTTTKWYRTCQECGHKQYCQPPNRSKELTDSYRNSKCRKCGSEGSLDYGTYESNMNDMDDDWS
jgi:hypothetical protein